jgi:hypothetical protein
MAYKRNIWQKICGVIAILSFISAVVCLGVYGIYSEELSKVYVASLSASAFFFFSVGIVLQVIATTNLPKLSAPTKDELSDPSN